MRRLAAAALAAGLSWAVVTPAQAAMQVVGAGLGESCWRAALAASRMETTSRDRPARSVRDAAWLRESLELCRTALREEVLTARDRAATHVNRGVLYIGLSAYGDAEAEFHAAARLQPQLPEPHVNQGVALIAMERFADAEAALDRGLALGPAEAGKAHFNRAIAREQRNDINGAYADYRRAAELEPQWPPPREELTRFVVETR